jgi:hypothetical protein
VTEEVKSSRVNSDHVYRLLYYCPVHPGFLCSSLESGPMSDDPSRGRCYLVFDITTSESFEITEPYLPLKELPSKYNVRFGARGGGVMGFLQNQEADT